MLKHKMFMDIEAISQTLMSNYYRYLTHASEEYVLKLLKRNNKLKNVERNNKIRISDYDLKVSNKLLDVQTSFNFHKYKDIRIDLLSAFNFKRKSLKEFPIKHLDLNSPELLKKELTIYKYGKWFDKNLHGVIFLLFNVPRPNYESEETYQSFIEKSVYKIYYLKRADLAKYLSDNLNQLNEIKVNDKKRNMIYESHNSAFLPLKLDVLINLNCGNIFNDQNELVQDFII